jgi:hypothetical protein
MRTWTPQLMVERRAHGMRGGAACSITVQCSGTLHQYIVQGRTNLPAVTPRIRTRTHISDVSHYRLGTETAARPRPGAARARGRLPTPGPEAHPGPQAPRTDLAVTLPCRPISHASGLQ